MAEIRIFDNDGEEVTRFTDIDEVRVGTNKNGWYATLGSGPFNIGSLNDGSETVVMRQVNAEEAAKLSPRSSKATEEDASASPDFGGLIEDMLRALDEDESARGEDIVLLNVQAPNPYWPVRHYFVFHRGLGRWKKINAIQHERLWERSMLFEDIADDSEREG